MINRAVVTLVGAVVLAISHANAAPLVFSSAGSTPAAIQATVDGFRTSLGPFNGNVGGPFLSGRREINWDAVPDDLADPNNLPLDLFNQNVPGRARGVVLSTPGSAVRVSADSSNPTLTQPLFAGPFGLGLVNFQAFSEQRLFAAVDSTIVDVLFFEAGSSTPALTRGFGAVFVDVELPGSTTVEFFGAGGGSLGVFCGADRGTAGAVLPRRRLH